MEMYDFFHQELTTLKSRTGFNQWEKLNEGPEPGKAINELIDFMIEETSKEPYKIVKLVVLQRVIHDAILSDGDFTGLNAKFVRRALNAWWGVYGGKILEARDQKPESVYEKVKLDPEASKRIDGEIDKYLRQLSGAFQKVPDIKGKEAEVKGAEWRSEIERKSVSKGYRKTSEQELIDRDLHIQYIRENYDPYTAKPKPNWISEDQWRKNLSRVPEAREVLHSKDKLQTERRD